MGLFHIGGQIITQLAKELDAFCEACDFVLNFIASRWIWTIRSTASTFELNLTRLERGTNSTWGLTQDAILLRAELIGGARLE
jgi:hypothetical protein